MCELDARHGFESYHRQKLVFKCVRVSWAHVGLNPTTDKSSYLSGEGPRDALIYPVSPDLLDIGISDYKKKLKLVLERTPNNF